MSQAIVDPHELRRFARKNIKHSAASWKTRCSCCVGRLNAAWARVRTTRSTKSSRKNSMSRSWLPTAFSMRPASMSVLAPQGRPDRRIPATTISFPRSQCATPRLIAGSAEGRRPAATIRELAIRRFPIDVRGRESPIDRRGPTLRAVLRTFLQEGRESLRLVQSRSQSHAHLAARICPSSGRTKSAAPKRRFTRPSSTSSGAARLPCPAAAHPAAWRKKTARTGQTAHQYAEDKLATRRWGYAAGREAAEYAGRAGQLGTVFDAEVPRALALLDRVLTSLRGLSGGSFHRRNGPRTGRRNDDRCGLPPRAGRAQPGAGSRRGGTASGGRFAP